MLAAFYCFAGITILSALAIVWTRQILYAAFALLFTFLGVAGLYVLAGADFVAVVQILIYVGGILVLLIFGVMLTNRKKEGFPVSGRVNRFTGLLVAVGLFAVFLSIFLHANLAFLDAKPTTNTPSSLPQIGVGLMTDYLVPFEVAAILLMVALMGAAFIAQKHSSNF